jgi:hypothetical protein
MSPNKTYKGSTKQTRSSEEQKLVWHELELELRVYDHKLKVELELTSQSLSFKIKVNNIFCKFNILLHLILIYIKSLKQNNLNGLHWVWEKSKFSSQLIRKFLKYFVFNSKYLEILKLLSSRVGAWAWKTWAWAWAYVKMF